MFDITPVDVDAPDTLGELDPVDEARAAVAGQVGGLLRGDAGKLPLRDESVDLIVTSPPYFSLRSYQDGGGHYDGQLGSEDTPQAFLEALWAATAEMARVLKPTGSIFVNLGDSYAGSGGYNNSNIGAGGRGPSSYRKAKWGNSQDGQPAQWTNANAAWLAGIIDGEGSISARVFQTGNSPSSVAWMRVGMMDPQVVDRIYEITGVGRVFQDKRGCYHYHVASQAARYVLERCWPWLLIKQRQALAAIELCRHVADRKARGSWSPLTQDDLSYRATIVDAIRTWNRREEHEWEPPLVPKVGLPDTLTVTPAKSLRFLPERYRIGCVDRLGLIARSVICWSKPNGLPESVTDRVRRSHEDWVHLTKLPQYFSAVDEIREAHAEHTTRYYGAGTAATQRPANAASNEVNGTQHRLTTVNPLGKLPGSVWTVPTEPLRVPDWLGVDHFAAFPTEWPRRLILGWSPSGVCVGCGEGRRPVVEKDRRMDGPGTARSSSPHRGPAATNNNPSSSVLAGEFTSRAVTDVTITGEVCACPDTTAPTRPAVVLDPFAGTGTVPMVARSLGRHGVGVDLSADYLRLARWRVYQSGGAAKAVSRTWRERQGGLFDEVVA